MERWELAADLKHTVHSQGHRNELAAYCMYDESRSRFMPSKLVTCLKEERQIAISSPKILTYSTSSRRRMDVWNGRADVGEYLQDYNRYLWHFGKLELCWERIRRWDQRSFLSCKSLRWDHLSLSKCRLSHVMGKAMDDLASACLVRNLIILRQICRRARLWRF